MPMKPFVTSQRALTALTWIGPLIVLALWFVVGEAALVSSLLLPPPHALLSKLRDLGLEIVWHTAATYARIIVCFGIGFSVGFALGLLMQFSQPAYVLLDGVIESWRPVPVIAFIPFAILLFGFSETGKIIVGSIGVALIIVVATVEAVERTPRAILLLGMTARLSRRDIFSSLIIPSVLPQLKAGARVALAVVATLVIAAEFMGANYGLGYLINTARVTLSTATIFLCILLLGIINAVLDMLLRRLFDRIGWWEIAQPASRS
jgi:ABC-type nitrate/sulfonate/bicarbonate transport system permease component